MKKFDITSIENIILVVPCNSKLKSLILEKGSSKERLYLIKQSLMSIFSYEKIIEVSSFDAIEKEDKRNSIVVIHEDNIPYANSPYSKDNFLARDCIGLNVVLITIHKPENRYGDGEIASFMSEESKKNTIGCIYENEFYDDFSKLVKSIMEWGTK